MWRSFWQKRAVAEGGLVISVTSLALQFISIGVFIRHCRELVNHRFLPSLSRTGIVILAQLTQHLSAYFHPQIVTSSALLSIRGITIQRTIEVNQS
jgi:hypothetical protein